MASGGLGTRQLFTRQATGSSGGGSGDSGTGGNDNTPNELGGSIQEIITQVCCAIIWTVSLYNAVIIALLHTTKWCSPSPFPSWPLHVALCIDANVHRPDSCPLQFAARLIPVLVMVAVGLLLAILITCGGCCLCCCRLCGKCGAKGHRYHSKNQNAKCLIWTVIFLLAISMIM